MKLLIAAPGDEPPTVFSSASKTESRFTTAQTKTSETSPGSANLSGSWAETHAPLDTAQNKSVENQTQPNSEIAETNSFLNKALPITAIVLALAHNYWQWLYMASPRAFEFPEFLWSINFLVWFFLLAAGAAAAIFAFRKSADKTLAVISLVVLAINFLLCIVPRRTF